MEGGEHLCNIRCHVDPLDTNAGKIIHYDIVSEQGNQTTEEIVRQSAPNYIHIVQLKRVFEYPITPGVVGAWGIYFTWGD